MYFLRDRSAATTTLPQFRLSRNADLRTGHIAELGGRPARPNISGLLLDAHARVGESSATALAG